MAGLGLAIGLVAGACQGGSAFVCTSSGDCVDGGAQGICEATGYCSFPDDECPSMQRYGVHAGALAGTCVPLGGSTGEDPTGGRTTGPSDTTAILTTGLDSSSGTSTPADSTTSGSEPWLVFTDDDEADFTAGMLSGLIYFDGGVRLDGAASGAFNSRVFDATETVSWRRLQWTPRGPYAKPLPGGRQSERGYVQGNADMSDNLLLLHLDDLSIRFGDVLFDTSGWGHDFIVETEQNLQGVPGVFGRAMADDSDSYAYNDMGSGNFSFGDDDFTWSLWFNTNAPCTGADEGSNRVYLGIEGPEPDQSHLWLGCRNPASPHCVAGRNDTGRLGGTYHANVSQGGPRVCSGSEIVDGQWHHAAVTKQGHGRTVVTLYLDGELADVEADSLEQPVDFPIGTELALGAFSGGSFAAEVTLDEVAIWRRAMSAAEVEGLFRRGQRRLTVRVRSCDDPDCETASEFVGPDGTVDTEFVDVADALGPGTIFELPEGLQGRYFQYRVELAGDPTSSPVLEAVTLEAEP